MCLVSAEPVKVSRLVQLKFIMPGRRDGLFHRLAKAFRYLAPLLGGVQPVESDPSPLRQMGA